MKKSIYCIVILTFLLSTGCYKDHCSYNPTYLTFINNTINTVNNFGKRPQVFKGDSISYKTFGISFNLNFIEYADPDICYRIPNNATKSVKIFTLNNFNSTFPANSNITSAFSHLFSIDEVPRDITTSILGKYNYFLLNESPMKDTIQQFIVISFDSYNDTVSVDTTRALIIKR